MTQFHYKLSTAAIYHDRSAARYAAKLAAELAAAEEAAAGNAETSPMKSVRKCLFVNDDESLATTTHQAAVAAKDVPN